MKQAVAEIVLEKTGEMVKFDSLGSGEPFYCDGMFWIKTSYRGDLSQGAARHLHSLESLDKYGFCAFGDGDYEMVEKVRITQKPL